MLYWVTLAGTLPRDQTFFYPFFFLNMPPEPSFSLFHWRGLTKPCIGHSEKNSLQWVSIDFKAAAEEVEATLTSSQDQTGITTKLKKTPWITNWRLAEQEFYNQGVTEGGKLRLAGRVETRKELVLLPRVEADIPEEYLNCRVVPSEKCGA